MTLKLEIENTKLKDKLEILEELKEQLENLTTEKRKSDELVKDLGEVIEQSDNMIKEYKNDNEDLRQKIWKAIRKIQMKDKELEEKEIELE